MMSWARESRSATRAAMYVSGVIDEKEWAGIHSSWPHDFQRSLRKFSSPSLFPSILSVAPDCIAQIFNSSSSNWHRCWWGSIQFNYWNLEGPQFLLKSCRLTQEEFLLLGCLLRSYFLWYLIYGGLHEEDVSGKGQTSWGIEHDWGIVWEKGRMETA